MADVGASGAASAYALLRRADGVVLAGAVGAGAGVVTEPVQFHAQPDQVLQGSRVDLAGDERGHRRIARHRGGGVAVQPPAPPSLPPAEASARCPAHCARTRAVHSSSSAELPSSTIRSAREILIMHPGLDRLPGPLGQQPGRDQAPRRPVLRAPGRPAQVLLFEQRTGDPIEVAADAAP